MPANPITDQILAKLDDTRRVQCCPAPERFIDTFDLFATRVAQSLPDVPADQVGQVLLHAGELFGNFATNNGTTPMSAEALAAVRILTEAGQRLYAPDGPR